MRFFKSWLHALAIGLAVYAVLFVVIATIVWIENSYGEGASTAAIAIFILVLGTGVWAYLRTYLDP